MLKRIFQRQGAAPKLQSVLPDPMDKFPHPQNKDFFEYLVRNWQVRELPPDKIYNASPHPELVAVFDEIADELRSIGDARTVTMYGIRFALTPENQVFAWAQGLRDIFVKPPQEQQMEALAAGGRLDATYPPDWVEFLAWGARMPKAHQPQWREVIQHWMQTSYDHAVGRNFSGVPFQPKPLEIPDAKAQAPSPTRAIVILTTTDADLDSLNPICRVLIGDRWLQEAQNHIKRSGGKGVTVVAGRNLSVRFPDRIINWSWARNLLWPLIIMGLAGRFFDLSSVALVSILAILPVLVVLVFVFNRTRRAEITVEGNLPDLVDVSDTLAAWVDGKRRREVRIEVQTENSMAAKAQTREQVHSMFQAALTHGERQGMAS